MSDDNADRQGLCFRCEFRALFNERGFQPRCECGDIKSCKYSCYMYRPVKPVRQQVNEGDDRSPFSGAMISARSHFVDLPEAELNVHRTKQGFILYWTPRINKKSPVKGKKKG